MVRTRRLSVLPRATRALASGIALCAALAGGPAAAAGGAPPAPPGFALIPAGDFQMGDHQGFVDPKHGGDETPIHSVGLDSFYMGVYDVTNRDYLEYLESARAAGKIEVRDGGVYLAGGSDLLCETRRMSPYSRIGWDGKAFSVLDGKEEHPVVGVRWEGAAAYCDWLSERAGLPRVYDEDSWASDLRKVGYRLPTEAEWEYAARGGLREPYRVFPWGDEADSSRANWPESDNPFRAGPEPWTTPVGFFDGSLRQKGDFGWPGPQSAYQTSDGANGFGLYDMSGNVWQFVNDWYGRDYYSASPARNPPGPDRGSAMPDGVAYRGMRGGSWYNGENGHGRAANRNPSYYRGPLDPDHPYYHLGFRVVLPTAPGAGVVAGRTPAATASPATASTAGTRAPGALAARPAPGSAAPGSASGAGFALSSPAVADGGPLPAEYTADGSSATLPLSWSGAPSGTAGYALLMHHLDPQGLTKSYWILYGIPAAIRSLPENSRSIGTFGANGVNGRAEYAPPMSSGPGPKTYVYTLYALSAAPKLDVRAEKVDRETLLAAMKGLVLATADLEVVYERPAIGAQRQGPNQGPPRDPGTRPQQSPNQGPQPEPGAAPPQAGAHGQGPAGAPAAQPAARAVASPTGANQSGASKAGPDAQKAMPENATPISPNAGQTVGLFLGEAGAYRGYTLFSPKHNTVTYLMDNEGRVVHQWKSAYEPGQSAYLKPNGNLVRCCFTRNEGFIGGGEGGRIEEYDWDGNLIWEFDYSSPEYLSHHDIALMPNGNILMLVVEKKTYEECLAAGFKPAMLRDRELYPDSVVEVKPTYPKGGEIVWRWRVWDHLIQDDYPAKANYGAVADHPELVDVESNGKAVPAFWNHMNSIAYNANLDQILLSVRGCSEIWILDHSATEAEAAGHSGGRLGAGGDLAYRWGNPAAYGRGSAADAALVQQHDAQWIPEGYPGAGNITIFNNGYDRLWSSVEEIAPPLGADGRYVLAAGKAYGPTGTAWHYEAPDRTDFFSSEISGAQRLPNGNTLVCAGVVGTLFEVTPAGKTVWEYVNPMVRGGILAQGELPGKDVRGHLFNAVFKARRYAPDYPGFAGRDLSPKGVVELPAAQKGKTGLDRLDEGAGSSPPGKGAQGGSAGPQDGRGQRPPRSGS